MKKLRLAGVGGLVQYHPGHEGRAGTGTQAECHPGPRHLCLLTGEEGSRQRGARMANGAQPEAGATDAESLHRPRVPPPTPWKGFPLQSWPFPQQQLQTLGPSNKIITDNDNDNCVTEDVLGNSIYKSDYFRKTLLYLAIILRKQQYSHPRLIKATWEDNATFKEKTRGSGSPAARHRGNACSSLVPRCQAC